MRSLLITFRLVGMSDERYREVCAELAPAFAELPGLLAKVWLADPDTGTYGGVYLFADDESVDAFTASRLYRTVAGFPHFTDLSAHRFRVDDDATRRTQPGIPIVAAATSAV